MRRFFGTDGIRGVANQDLTSDIAFKCGNALTTLTKYPTVVVGRDTRQSGDMLALSLASGVIAGGGNVLDIGIMPTAAIAYLTKYFGASYGVVISASHNPPEYNGIKVFGADGYKLLEEQEEEIEECFNEGNFIKHPNLGRYKKIEYGADIYVDYLRKTCPEGLNGLKVVLDCSNGASYEVAPQVFKLLGAEVKAYNCENTGVRINVDCGSLHPDTLAKKVVEKGADIGFAFDGDSDRLIAIDELGNKIDGDQLIYMMSCQLKENGKLKGNMAVGTHHTNMGIQKAFENKGIKLLRSDIGDKYVMELMLKKGAVIGGEQSGHIIMSEYATTGDGILSAIQVARLLNGGKKLSEALDVQLYPQVNINVTVKDKIRVMNNEELAEFIDICRDEIKDKGRILVRASGTEPRIRVMVECEDVDMAQRIANNIVIKVKEI